MAVSLKKLLRPFHKTEAKVKAAKSIRKKYKPEKARLIFIAECPSSSGDKVYTAKIAFRVNKVRKGEVFHTIRVDGSTIRYTPPTIRSKAKVRCTCPDYLYTFAKSNEMQGAHLGKDVPADDVKGKGTGKPRNPKKVAGCCKHIQSLARAAERRGYIME